MIHVCRILGAYFDRWYPHLQNLFDLETLQHGPVPATMQDPNTELLLTHAEILLLPWLLGCTHLHTHWAWSGAARRPRRGHAQYGSAPFWRSSVAGTSTSGEPHARLVRDAVDHLRRRVGHIPQSPQRGRRAPGVRRCRLEGASLASGTACPDGN
jgi:hypothetical protein